MKSSNSGRKLELSANGVTEKIADWECVDTASVQETSFAARDACWRRTYDHEWGKCDEKDEGVLGGNDAGKKLHIKGVLEEFHGIKNAKEKMLEGDPNW